MRKLVAVIWAFVVCLTAGCAPHPSDLANTATKGEGRRPEAEFRPDLPVPAVLAARLPSATAALTLDGAAYEDSLLNNNVARAGQSAVYSPDWNPLAEPPRVEPAFAVYAYSLAGQQAVQEFDCSWAEGESPGDFWVALSNFSAERWDWYNLEAGEPQAMPALPDYLDGEGRLLVVILLLAPGTLNQLELRGEGPVADFSADPTTGPAPLLVSFDAGASHDPDGYIAKYEWDFTGDLLFEYDAGTNPLAQHEYAAAADYTAYLRVTDNWGAFDVASVDIQVSGEEPGWHALTIGTTNFNYGPSLAVINGNPAAVFGGAGIGEPLSYVRAVDALGTSWGEQLDINHDGPVQVRLVAAGGRPAVLYYAVTTWLSYVRADDENGTAWGAAVQVAQPSVITSVYSMNMVGGLPAFGYDTLFPAEGFYYQQADDVEGDSWSSPVIAASSGNLTDLSEVGGRPAFCLTGETGEDLYFLRASDSAGTSWGAPIPVDLDCVVGYFPKLLVVNGNPAIFYIDWSPTPTKLLYARAEDENGGSWSSPVPIADGDGFPSPALIGGRPALTFIGGGDPYNIYYARADDENGDSWPAPELVIPDAGFFETSCAEVAGRPAFIYSKAGEEAVDVIYMVYY
jgi:PKD repeat protein